MESLDCFGTVLSVELGGLMDLGMADGLMDAESRKGSGLPAEILEAGSTAARTLPTASNKVFPEMLIPS